MVYSLTTAIPEQRGDGVGMRQRIAEILAPLRRDRSAVVVALQRVQGELGYIPPEAFYEIARALVVSPSEVYGVATFYAQFYLTPRAQHQVRVCSGTACHVRGGERLLEAASQELRIGVGQNTPDMNFGLEKVACFGACAIGPVVVVDEEVHGRMTAGKARQLLQGLKEK